MNIQVKGTGYAFPSKILNNIELEQMVDKHGMLPPLIWRPAVQALFMPLQ